MIELQQLNKRYTAGKGASVQALSDLSLQVPAGSLFGLLGQIGRAHV